MASAKDSFLNLFLSIVKCVLTLSCGLTFILVEEVLLVMKGLVVVRWLAASPAPSCRRGLGGGKCRPSSGLGEGIRTN